MLSKHFYHFRVFSRIATIPFEKISGVQTLQQSLDLKASLQPLLGKAVLSIGILLQLREDFRHMREDSLFEVSSVNIGRLKMAPISNCNVWLPLFSVKTAVMP